MKLKHLLTILVLCCCSQIVIAKKHHLVKTAIAVPQEDNYDVQYVKIDLEATNQSTAISGNSITKAKVVAANFNEYYFELTNQLHIDSAKFNGQNVTVDSVSMFVRKITLSNSLSQNSIFKVQVFYHGAPTGGTGFFTVGILNGQAGNPLVKVTQTVSAAYHSRDWFPSKQSFRDKIDSADVWITVDTNLKVASNGLLQNITVLSSNKKRFEWHTKYPIDYYLLSFCVAPYSEYNYYMHFNNSNDSMLVQNYFLNDTVMLNLYQDEMDSVANIINHFSNLFGKYPFDKEKTGTCIVSLSGGMENQTLVSIGGFDTQLMAHELSHQWWGDNVTCGNVTDMWLNEGLATYCEHLFLEEFHGITAANNFRTGVFNNVMSSVGGTTFVSDTTAEWRIYDGRLTYYKGAAITHMLRYLINNDSLFFQVLKNYQQQFAYGNALTQDMNSIANQVSGQALDTFFNQWIYKEGYPTYAAKWAQGGNKVCFKLNQTTSKPSSVSVFKLPVEIKLLSPQGDTIIKVFNDQSSQYYSINWSHTMTGLQIDPNNHIVNKQGIITNDTSLLEVNDVATIGIRIFPNPTQHFWTIQQLPFPCQLELCDMLGQIIWKETTLEDSIQIPAHNLAVGNYTLTIHSKDKKPISFLLTKQ